MKTIEQLDAYDKVYHFNNCTFAVFENELDFKIEVDWHNCCNICIGEEYLDCELEGGKAMWCGEGDFKVFFFAEKEQAVEEANKQLRKKMQELYATLELNTKML